MKDFVLFPDWLKKAFKKVFRDRVILIGMLIFLLIAIIEAVSGNFALLFFCVMVFFFLLRVGTEEPPT